MKKLTFKLKLLHEGDLKKKKCLNIQTLTGLV